MPNTMFFKLMEISFISSRPQMSANEVSMIPDAVMQYQKLTCDAVQGENIINQSTAAMQTDRIFFFILYNTHNNKRQGIKQAEG